MPLGDPLSPTLLIGGIECCLDLGPDGTNQAVVERWPAEGPSVDVDYKCRWADRYPLAQAILGSSTVVDGVNLRVPPHQFFESPNLYAASIGNILRIGLTVLQSAEGLAPAGWVKGDYAILPVTYIPARFDFGSGPEPIQDPSGQPWTTTRFRVSGEVFTPPNGVFYYSDGSAAGVPVHDSLLGIVRPQVEISMTRHWLPGALDLQGIMALIGSVNDRPLMIGNQEFIEGHLLFAGFNATEQFDSLGQRTFEVEYGILGRQDYGWNTLMAPDGEWYVVNTEIISGSEEGDYPFRLMNFADIP